MRIDWLGRIINESDILKGTFLSDKERLMTLQFVIEKREINQIAQEFNLSDYRVRKILNDSINKIIQGINDLIFKSQFLDEVIKDRDNFALENKELKSKFKKYLKNESQLKMDFQSANQNIEILRFSVRAKRILGELNVKKVKDLSQVTLNDLNNKSQIGRKTIAEIISKSEKYGIKIN
jgi:hypothetical protein